MNPEILRVFIRSAISVYDGKLNFRKPEAVIVLIDGLIEANKAFREVNLLNDLDTMVIAEFTFLSQERALHEQNDSLKTRSLDNALHEFIDAMKALKYIKNLSDYKGAVNTHSTKPKNTTKGVPKDVFHMTCNSHIRRLNNSLREVFIPEEEILLHQRLINVNTFKSLYIEQQRKALGLS